MRALGYTTLLIAALLVFAAAGCQAPAQPTGPTLANVPAQDAEALDHLWQSTENTLFRRTIGRNRTSARSNGKRRSTSGRSSRVRMSSRSRSIATATAWKSAKWTTRRRP
jgi:hypothetical protein